jgi:hypothetical protein
MKDKDATQRTARRTMLKAYITYSKDIKNLTAEKTFNDQVQEISDEQSVFVDRMCKGIFPDNIEVDPRTIDDSII